MKGQLISVVIQGPLGGACQEGGALDVKAAITSLRQHLPGAEIIVSTWLDEAVDELDADVVVTNEMPLPVEEPSGNRVYLAAQILSTLAGLQAATRPYALKFRADLLLESTAFIDRYFASEEVPRHCRFSRPIAITNLFTRDPARFSVLFHLSDVVQLGARDDLISYWSSPQTGPDELLLGDSWRFRILGNYLGNSSLRFLPEQYLTISWLQRHGVPITLAYPSEMSFRLCRLWEKELLQSFILLDWGRSGIRFPARFFTFSYAVNTVYTEQLLKRVRGSVESSNYLFRYSQVLYGRYLGCWFSPRYWLSVSASILFKTFPRVAVAIRGVYHRKTGAGRD